MRNCLSIVIALLFLPLMLKAEEKKPENSLPSGKLKKPFGTIVTIQGRIVSKLSKGEHERGPHILIHKINGKEPLENIIIMLAPCKWSNFKKKEDLKIFQNGKTFEITGFETGSFLGMPNGILEKYYKETDTQFLLYNFFHRFAVWKAKEIPPLDPLLLGKGKLVHKIVAPKFTGKLKNPLGTVLTVQGKVGNGTKGYYGMRVQKINGKATQKDIHIILSPYENGEFKEQKDIYKLEYGKTYELTGFETAAFVGTPKKIYKDYKKKMRHKREYHLIQGRFFNLFLTFAVYKGKEIKPSE